ncbi:hypothetical protein DFH06DRAFT_1060516 [Mycena polygramma]|nr:hypothetical protein DFH06DRAFT_1060516 [Mycena polygramma]
MTAAATASKSTSTKRAANKAECSASTGKKHHVCPVCERGFSTTGHLARHARVHTGERNHKCPFPGCETKCSRQDNLQQHYRIHLSPGSRRKSGRAALRSPSTPAPSPPAASPSASSSNDAAQSIRDDSPPLSPPPLEDSRLYFFNAAQGGAVASPPNSPPPLEEAYGVHAAAPRAETDNAYPQVTHRMLPAIDTSASARSRIASPVDGAQWSACPASLSGSTYPSPTAYTSSSASTYPSPTVQYSASPVAYATKPLPQPHPHAFRHASHSPAAAAVPVARSLAARHSIGDIGAHVQAGKQHVGEEQPLPVVQQQIQIPVHQPVPQAPQCATLAYHADRERHVAELERLDEQRVLEQHMNQHPDQYTHPHPETYTPSPPPSAQHSPQTPYTPFPPASSAPAVVHAPAAPHPGAYASDVQQYEYVYPSYPEDAVLSYHPTTYNAPAATYAPYDARGHVAFGVAYGAVPAMHYERAYEYGKQHYVSPPARKAYSPLLLAALPSLRRASVQSVQEGYATARRGSEGEPHYQQQSPEQSPQTGYACAAAPATVQTPYLHQPQPQQLVGTGAGDYLAEYAHQSEGWRVAEVQ